MGVRLNKVLSELNIGLQTAVDFLKKKSSLGEIKDDATSNTKISDEQYEALVKKEKEKKKEEEAPKVEARQEFKPLGKIDLDSLNKRPATAAPKETPKTEAAAGSPVKEEKKEEIIEAKVEVEDVKQESKPERAIVEDEEEIKPSEEETVAVQDDEEETDVPEEDDNQEEEPAQTAPTVFTLKSEAKLAPKVNVLGKIDLDSLNQSTRPKKKSKEEKKKEREEKLAQQRSEKKKRRKKRRRLRK